MKIHAIIHADFELPSYFKTWAKSLHFPFTTTHIYRGDPLPAVEEYDVLLCMGGPQSPLKIDEFPYLKDEIEHIKNAIGAREKTSDCNVNKKFL